MEPFEYRIFVCIRERPGHQESCAANGSHETIVALKEEIRQRGLVAEVKVNQSSCLDLCSGGPHLIVYPQGIWYSGLTPEHVPAFVESQLIKGEHYRPCVRDEKELASLFTKKKASKVAKAESLSAST